MLGCARIASDSHGGEPSISARGRSLGPAWLKLCEFPPAVSRLCFIAHRVIEKPNACIMSAKALV